MVGGEGGKEGSRVALNYRPLRLPSQGQFHFKSYYSKWCSFDIELVRGEAKVYLFNVD